MREQETGNREQGEPESGLVPFPQLSGVNWPSYLLQAWLTLHQMGVPEKNLRFLPEIGHFALPEVVEEEPGEDWERHSGLMELRHPQSARYDPATERATVTAVNPRMICPRLKVNVRADVIWRDTSQAGAPENLTMQQVGRLAHFMEPLLAGLPALPTGEALSGEQRDADAEPAESALPENEAPRERVEQPLARLTRQICASYPELMRVVPVETRNILSAWAANLLRALESTEPEDRQRWLHQAAQAIPEKADRALLAEWFEIQAGKSTLPLRQGDEAAAVGARARLREWGATLTLDTPNERATSTAVLANDLSDAEISQQRMLLQLLGDRLTQETGRERYRIVRELMEILTTEVFTSVAVLDYLWGIGWIHGQAEDFRLPLGKLPAEGVFLSFTGGLSQRTLLLLLMQKWLQAEGFLGVFSRPLSSEFAGSPEVLSAFEDDEFAFAGRSVSILDGFNPAPEANLSDICDTNLLSAQERQELWSLVAWRREAPDPLLLLQTALQRLIDPGIEVQWDHYQNVGGGFNTLFSQPGATAALGGMVQVHYPGVTIYMPLIEDGDDAAIAAKSRLTLLLRLFLPVCLRADVIWKECVARMGQGSYLRHPYQSGVRIGT